jgi:hypothetical protein
MVRVSQLQISVAVVVAFQLLVANGQVLLVDWVVAIKIQPHFPYPRRTVTEPLAVSWAGDTRIRQTLCDEKS